VLDFAVEWRKIEAGDNADQMLQQGYTPFIKRETALQLCSDNLLESLDYCQVSIVSLKVACN